MALEILNFKREEPISPLKLRLDSVSAPKGTEAMPSSDLLPGHDNVKCDAFS